MLSWCYCGKLGGQQHDIGNAARQVDVPIPPGLCLYSLKCCNFLVVGIKWYDNRGSEPDVGRAAVGEDTVGGYGLRGRIQASQAGVEFSFASFVWVPVNELSLSLLCVALDSQLR
jgi:hypothetical protein